MRRVILESPYKGDVSRNLRYVIACIQDCLRRGDSPYASHVMLTRALDDDVPEERTRGIEAGFAWRTVAEATVVYEDLGISSGMKYGIEDAQAKRQPIEYRQLGPGWDKA